MDLDELAPIFQETAQAFEAFKQNRSDNNVIRDVKGKFEALKTRINEGTDFVATKSSSVQDIQKAMQVIAALNGTPFQEFEKDFRNFGKELTEKVQGTSKGELGT